MGMPSWWRCAAGPMPESRSSCGELIAPQVCDSHTPLLFHQQTGRVGMGKHRQIAPPAGWFQICIGCAVALPPLLRHLVDADPFLFCPVEIVVVWPAKLDTGCHKGARQGIDAAQVGDVEGTTHSVIGGRASLLV